MARIAWIIQRIPYSHKIPYTWERKAEQSMGDGITEEGSPRCNTGFSCVAGFENGERGHKSRNVTASRNKKNARKWTVHHSLQEAMKPCGHHYFNPMRSGSDFTSPEQ